MIDKTNQILDVLIAISATKVGATLSTENIGDMNRWKGILTRMGKKLKWKYVNLKVYMHKKDKKEDLS